MYRALYRKYRPQVFDDVVGQNHITQTLKNQLSSGKVFHAYLFTGTRGTGKTTCAKILSNAVNCESLKDGNPCGECDACKAINSGEVMDISEIDAASNNGVDDIREIRERVAFAPADFKYRVYIIDEVHMLSTPAFNALLKTLEEPPAHVVFILATTEVHKLPATILSRCQRFDFKRINTADMISRIKTVCDSEGFTLTDSAAQLICSVADGGMRDALSILDLCSSKDKNITEDVVSSVCSMAGKQHLIKFTEYINMGSTKEVLSLVDKLYADSADMQRLTHDLIQHYRNLLIVKTVNSGELPIVCSTDHLAQLRTLADQMELRMVMRALRVLCDALAAMRNSNARLELEMALVSLCSPQSGTDIAALEARITALERALKNGVVINNAPPKTVAEPATDTAKEQPKVYDPDTEPEYEPDGQDLDTDALDNNPNAKILDAQPSQDSADDTPYREWSSVLNILKTTCPIMYGVLSDSVAYVKDDLLLIDAKNPAFRNLVKGENATYRDNIRKAAEQVSGKVFKLGPYVKKQNTSSSVDPLKALAEKLNNL